MSQDSSSINLSSFSNEGDEEVSYIIPTIDIADSNAFKLPGKLVFQNADTDPDLVTRKILRFGRNHIGIKVRNSIWVLCRDDLISNDTEQIYDQLVIASSKKSKKRNVLKEYCIRFAGSSEITLRGLERLDWAIDRAFVPSHAKMAMTSDFVIPYYRSISKPRNYLEFFFEDISYDSSAQCMSMPLSFRPFSWFWTDKEQFNLDDNPQTEISYKKRMLLSIFGFTYDRRYNNDNAQKITFAVLGMIQQTSDQKIYPPQRIFLENGSFNTILVPDGPKENSPYFGIAMFTPFIEPIANTLMDDPTQANLKGNGMNIFSLVSRVRNSSTASKFYATVKQGVKIILDPNCLSSVLVHQIISRKQTFNIFEITANPDSPERTIVKALNTSRLLFNKKQRYPGDFVLIKLPSDNDNNDRSTTMDASYGEESVETGKFFFVPTNTKGIGRRNIFPRDKLSPSVIDQQNDTEFSTTTIDTDDAPKKKPSKLKSFAASIKNLFKYIPTDNLDIIRISEQMPSEDTTKIINSSFVRWVMIVGHGQPNAKLGEESQLTDIKIKYADKESSVKILPSTLTVLSAREFVVDEENRVTTGWYKIDRLFQLKKHSLAETPLYSPVKLSIGQPSYKFKIDWNENIMSGVNLIDGPVNGFQGKVSKSVIWDSKKETYLVVYKGLIRASNANELEKCLSLQKPITLKSTIKEEESILRPGTSSFNQKYDHKIYDLCEMNQFGTEEAMKTNVFSKPFRSNSKDDIKKIYVCEEISLGDDEKDLNGWSKSKIIDELHFYKASEEDLFQTSPCNQGNCQIVVILTLMTIIFTLVVCF